MRRLNTAEVLKKFEEKGWTLRDEYTKSSVPLLCICPSGHEVEITWNNFQKGQGCRKCAGNERFTTDEVRAYFREQGCELLDDTYVNSATPLRYRCVCGTESSMIFRDFRRGHRCQECMKNNLSSRFRRERDDVVSYFEQHGCKLKGEYRNNRTPVEFLCRCGRTGVKTLNNFQKSPQCAQCGHEQKAGDKCYRWNPDRDAVEYAKKFRKRCGNALARCLHATGQAKIGLTMEMLGYSPQQLQDHVFNHPEYKTEMGMDFHIDHIFPIQAFLDHGITDLKLINCLENLRPLPGRDNIVKGSKYDVGEFRQWLASRTKGNASHPV